MNTRRIEFSCIDEDIVFGNYDIMYPQTSSVKKVSQSFDGDVSLDKYFNSYVRWLIEIGFSKEQIAQQMNRYCDFQDEFSLDPS